MEKRIRALLEKADKNLNEAGSIIKIALGELHYDLDMQILVSGLFKSIDKARQQINAVLADEPLDDDFSSIETYKYTTDDASVVFTNANH